MRYLPFLFVIFGAALLVSLAQKHDAPSTGRCCTLYRPQSKTRGGELELFSFGPGFAF